MNIHEYQAKELLRLYKVATPDGKVAQDAEEARMITKEYGGASVVKAQIHAGGRGKGGGVKFANDPDKAADLFKALGGGWQAPHYGRNSVLYVLRCRINITIQAELNRNTAVPPGTA